MKKIVVINQSSGYLFIDITNELAERFNDVVLVSGNNVERENLKENIRLDRIIPYNKKNTITRFYSWVVGFFQLLHLIQQKYSNYQIFISTNPPLATLLPLFCKNKISLIIYDIYPDGLVSGGFISRKNIIYKTWKMLNIKSYKKVDQIISITEGMTKLLCEYAEKDKIRTIPVWADKEISKFDEKKDGKNFKSEYGLENKFVVMYSGNIGKNHALESLVKVAQKLKCNKQIHFVIAGEGWKKQIVKEMVNELNVYNCTLLSFMKKDLFASSLYGTDLGVVSLGEDTSKIAIPSKTFNLLAAGKPLLCFAGKDSDLSYLVKKYKVGEVFSHHEINKAASFIQGLFENEQSKHKKLAENAANLAVKYSYRNASKIASLISDS